MIIFFEERVPQFEEKLAKTLEKRESRGEGGGEEERVSAPPVFKLGRERTKINHVTRKPIC